MGKSALVVAALFAIAASSVGAMPGVSGSIGRIAFVRSGSVWVANADGTSLHRVTHPKRDIYDDAVSWSPDGSQLAFVRTDGATCGLPCISVDIVRSDGTGFTASSGSTEPRWSPDGTRLLSTEYFGQNVRGFTTSTLEISDVKTGKSFVLAPRASRGGSVRSLRLGYDISDYAWSPDGVWICFSRAIGGESRLALVHPDGTGLRLLSGQSGLSDCDWAPDSTRVLASDGHRIYSTTLTDARPTPLTGRTAGEASPRWSPDGARIAFLRREPGSVYAPSDLWTMAADGSDQELLAADAWSPSWSPDGSLLGFITLRSAAKTHPPRSPGLWVAPLDGTAPTEVAAGATDFDWQVPH